MNRNKGSWKKLGLLVLCLCMALSVCCIAAAETAVTVAEMPAETIGEMTPAITDTQAAAGFITQVMTGKKLTPPRPRGTVSGDQLTGREALLYAALKPLIQQAAAGEISDTAFQIPVREIFENNPYASTADFSVDSGLVIRALLNDMPYDLYWYDKTSTGGSLYQGPRYFEQDGSIYIWDYANENITVNMRVSAGYTANGEFGTTYLDPSFGGRAHSAAANAHQLIEENKYKSDLHKLQAYKEYICDHVDYNYDAADGNNNTSYGDPWQLVYALDSDPSTKVVCEGYSKAFQFLCDESAFRNGTLAVSVSGTMSGGTGAGGHMWNVVRMADGQYYMADITNSDSGSVGQDGGLFLNGCIRVIPENNQYEYAAGGRTITYMYDSDTLRLLENTGMLAMASTDYALPTRLGSDREVTWYPELSTVYPGVEDGVYGLSSIGHMWLPEQVRDLDDYQSLSWSLILQSGPDNFEVAYSPDPDWAESWRDGYFYAEAKPKAGLTSMTPGTSVYTMRCEYQGETYEGTLTIHTVDPSAVPTGISLKVYEADDTNGGVPEEVSFDGNAVTVTTGRSYWLRGDFAGGMPTGSPENYWLDPDFHNGGAERGDRWSSETPDTVLGLYGSNTERFLALEPGIYTAYASMTLENSNLEAFRSFTLRVADAEGNVPENSSDGYSLEVPPTWPAGKNLVIDWEPYVEDMWIYVDISTTGSDGEYTVFFDSRQGSDGESFTIPGYKLNEGLYRLSCWARTPSYEATTPRIFDFEVTANPERPAAPTDIRILSSDGTPLTEEECLNLRTGMLPVQITYPQAMQMLEMEIWQEGESGSSEFFRKFSFTPRAGADTVLNTGSEIYMGDEGMFYILVRVMVNDTWSPWSDAVLFGIVPLPQLAAPTVTPDKETMILGEPLTLTITGIDQAAQYISVQNVTGDYYEFTIRDLTEPVTVTIPEEYFFSGENGIAVIAGSDQARGGRTELTVQVTGQRPAAPTVSFSATSAQVGETVYATVNAPGASQVQMASMWESDYFGLRNGSVRISLYVYYYSNRNISYRFRAQVNGVWSEWTEYYQISSLTERPSYAGQQFVEMPDEIVPGQDVEITFLPVDGVTLYYIHMEHDYAFCFYHEYTQPGKVTLPAILFADGGWYGFDVGCGDQYSPDILTKGKTYEMDPVSEPVGPALTISAEKTNLFYSETAEISLSVPAEQIMWQRIETNYWTGKPCWVNTNVMMPRDGEETMTSFDAAFGYDVNGGEYSIRATALVNGAWTDWSNTLTFTESPREPELLTNPVPRVDAEIPEGNPVLITWDAVERAESYTVYWHGLGNGVDGRMTTSDLSLTIPAELPIGDYTVRVLSEAAGYGNDYRYILVYFTVVDHGPLPLLNVSIDKQSYDYGESACLTVSITNADGSTDGLEELYPDACISATLVDAAGEPVPGFIVQTSPGLEMSVSFPLADDAMPAGQYRILVETNIPGLRAETELFQYTAERPDMPDLTECSVELSLNTDVFGLDELFRMTASVTDKEGNPVKGVKVGFMILDSEGNLVTDFFSCDWIWNTTKENGQCGLSITREAGEGHVLKPATYQADVFLVDMDTIHDVKPFEFRLESLYLPASLTAIGAEAFAGTDSQAVFVPEGCVSIGERAFANCAQLYYIHIPATVTDIAESAFEGCPDDIWIDRE